MQEIYTQSDAQKNLFNILKNVAIEHKAVLIQQNDPALDAVIINKKDWDAMQEKLASLRANENEQDVDFNEMWRGWDKSLPSPKQLAKDDCHYSGNLVALWVTKITQQG